MRLKRTYVVVGRHRRSGILAGKSLTSTGGIPPGTMEQGELNKTMVAAMMVVTWIQNELDKNGTIALAAIDLPT